MKGTYLGEFEEIVLLAVAALQKEAYGLAIKKDLEEQTDRKITIVPFMRLATVWKPRAT